MTPGEQQTAHKQLTETALSTLDWTEGQQKVRGYIAAGWRIREAGNLAEELLRLATGNKPEQIFGDTPEAKDRRVHANGLLANIASLKDSRR